LNLFSCIELFTFYAVIVLICVCRIYIKSYLLTYLYFSRVFCVLVVIVRVTRTWQQLRCFVLFTHWQLWTSERNVDRSSLRQLSSNKGCTFQHLEIQKRISR